MIELIPTVATSFVTAMAANSMKGAKGPAQALDDIMSLVGFEKLHFYAEKKRAKNEIYIKDYKEKIAQELVNIAEENIQEPPLAIVGPAIEASKFYIEEDELRSMFATLIASSMDSSKNTQIHTSYVEIIKQMSSIDASIVDYISSNLSGGNIALVNLGEQMEQEQRYRIYYEHVPNFTISNVTYTEMATSLQNLHRLGLISIEYQLSSLNEEMYLYVKETVEYKILLEQFKDDKKIKIIKGFAKLTPYGRNFCNICL